ncbi:hypothetical protein TNCV_4568441 [Trichonephila clavipes]|nr:hypothetical protein TNCV_4568441 [Trichonephila clavipes]
MKPQNLGKLNRKKKMEKIKIAYARKAVIDYNKNMGHHKFPEKQFASNSYSGPVKLKFSKHTVSEKDRLKKLATFQPNANPEDVFIAVPERSLTERDGCALTVMSGIMHDSKK